MPSNEHYPDYTCFRQPPWQGLVLGALGDQLPAVLALEAPGSSVAGGRGTVQVVDLDDRRAVIRRYRRGGIMRLLDDRYLSNRPQREFEVLLRARKLGLPVPEPLAAAWTRRGGFYRGKLATTWIAGEDLDERLRRSTEAPATEALLEACGGLFRRVHDSGFYHADLQVKNLRLSPEGPVLLDFDNARYYNRSLPRHQRARNLLRFRRSLEKNGLSRHYFRSILAGYGDFSIPRWLQVIYTIKGRLSSLSSGRRTHA